MKPMPVKINGRYYNDHNDSINLRLRELVAGTWAILKHRISKVRSQPKNHFFAFDFLTTPTFQPRSQMLSITWLGHATFLIQVDGINILTDPLLGDLSPVVKRFVKSPVSASQLPPIDIILISHNHKDHTDIPTLKQLVAHNPHLYVPEGNAPFFKALGFSRITESTWWAEHTFKGRFASFDIACLPASHWTSRGLFDVNKTLWGSWLLRHQQGSVYFAGDTAYGDHFKHIAQHYAVDIALMPIGPVEPRELMVRAHMGPEEAVEAFKDLSARIFIPMHWGTFEFGTDYPMLPLERLMNYCAVQQDATLSDAIKTLKLGQTLHALKDLQRRVILNEQEL